MIVTVLPAICPVTVPVVRPTVAASVLLLVHVPPVIASLSVSGIPVHNDVLPVIGATGLTVITLVTAQPDPNV